MGKLVRNGIDYSTPIVDGRLDTTSANPVQNKVVANAIADISHSIVTIDNNGDLWVGDTQIWHFISSADYAELQDKERMIYFVYQGS